MVGVGGGKDLKGDQPSSYQVLWFIAIDWNGIVRRSGRCLSWHGLWFMTMMTVNVKYHMCFIKINKTYHRRVQSYAGDAKWHTDIIKYLHGLNLNWEDIQIYIDEGCIISWTEKNLDKYLKANYWGWWYVEYVPCLQEKAFWLELSTHMYNATHRACQMVQMQRYYPIFGLPKFQLRKTNMQEWRLYNILDRRFFFDKWLKAHH